ncbi:NepR family anti-sigma factor, partial [Acinetobacter baumannii]
MQCTPIGVAKRGRRKSGGGQQLPGLDPRPPQWAEDIRKFYDDAAKEPVPDELKALMDALARQIEPPG